LEEEEPKEKMNMEMEQSIPEFKDTFEESFIKGLPPFWDGKGKLYDQEE
jgi:hypothetical protein